jgi:hypothetical protein
MFSAFKKLNFFFLLEKILLEMQKKISIQKYMSLEYKDFKKKIDLLIQKVRFQRENNRFLITKKSIKNQYRVEKK